MTVNGRPAIIEIPCMEREAKYGVQGNAPLIPVLDRGFSIALPPCLSTIILILSSHLLVDIFLQVVQTNISIPFLRVSSEPRVWPVSPSVI